jgi:hypothetical protein
MSLIPTQEIIQDKGDRVGNREENKVHYVYQRDEISSDHQLIRACNKGKIRVK